MIFLSIEEVIQIHDDLVSAYGSLHGIRDMELLCCRDANSSHFFVNIYMKQFLTKLRLTSFTLFAIMLFSTETKELVQLLA